MRYLVKILWGGEFLPKEKLNYYDYITEIEERNIQKTGEYFSKELEFQKETLGMLYDALKSITNCYSDEWSHSKKASLFLLPRLIMSTKSTLDLLIRGYYFDYTVVQRSLIECVALLTYLSKDEEAAKKWLNFEKLEVPKWKLMHRLFSSPTKKILKLVDKMYAEESEYVHSGFFAVFSEWLRHLARRKKVLEMPRFEKSFIGEELSNPRTLLIVLFLVEIFSQELEKGFRMKVMNLAEGKALEWKAKGHLKY